MFLNSVAKVLQNCINKTKHFTDKSTILTDLFNTMIEALDNLDIDEMENVINELDKYSYDESQTGLLEQLRTEVANIDIDKCDKIIDEWKALLK